MFDIGASELLVIAIVAILVIGPKDMPMALRAAGRWIGKIRRMSAHFRSGVETMIREAEMEEMEQKWAERNKEIMAKYPDGEPAEGAPADLLDGEMRPLAPPPPGEGEADAAAEAAIARAKPRQETSEAEPSLPLDPPAPPPPQPFKAD